MATIDFDKEKIRDLRAAMALDQTEFAARVGVSQATVSLWESGDRNPTGSARLLLEMLSEKYLRKKFPK